MIPVYNPCPDALREQAEDGFATFALPDNGWKTRVVMAEMGIGEIIVEGVAESKPQAEVMARAAGLWLAEHAHEMVSYVIQETVEACDYD